MLLKEFEMSNRRAQRIRFLEIFQNLNNAKFWVLDVTSEGTKSNGDFDMLSVKEELCDFMLDCGYLQCVFHRLILYQDFSSVIAIFLQPYFLIEIILGRIANMSIIH